MARTNEAVVRDCNELARKFYLMHGNQVKDRFDFFRSSHPQEIMMWDMAVAAFEYVNGTCVESALIETGQWQWSECQQEAGRESY